MPSPGQRNIHKYLRNNLVVFIITTLLFTAAAAFTITSIYSIRTLFAEMVANANAATLYVPEFYSELESTLLTFADSTRLLDGTKMDRRALSRLYSNNGDYDQVLMVNDQKLVIESYPSEKSDITLTDRELEVLNSALEEGNHGVILEVGNSGEPELSIVIPVFRNVDGVGTALIGRVKKSSLANNLSNLTKNNPKIAGALVDLDGKLIVKVGPEQNAWSGEEPTLFESLLLPDDNGGTTLLGQNDTGLPYLIYFAPPSNHNWRVAVSSPLTIILKPGLIAAGGLGSILMVIAGFFYFSMNQYARELSHSISDLTRSSRNFTVDPTHPLRGGNGRKDELGDLSQALDEMQRVLKKRLNEQSMLLAISQESSTGFELSESLPIVINGALRGTGSAGIRILVLSPGGGQPVSYAEGPAANSMRVLDNKLLALMRQQEELQLNTQQAIYDHFEIDLSTNIPIKALYALPLQVENKFLGFLTVGFRDEREFSRSESTFIQFLAGRASILVQKSFLYTYAEGGRKRLKAVLESTSEAVIVTDPTARIIRINRAAEQAFNVEAQQVMGRKVADVVDSPTLVNALTSGENDSRDLEIQGKDGCTYFANISRIISHDGKELGRVSVLHDVTYLKEIDRLKSEFIDNVSHDLRTPLTVLSGYSSALALLDDLTVVQREYADHILRNVERMVKLVEDLLDVGRIEAGVDLVFEYIDIGQLLQDLADEHWLYAHESGVRIGVRTAGNLPLIRCDRRLLKRAISNLLMNGFKYAPNSGDITLAAGIAEDELLISVRDRGPGIAREDQLRLFEKFYRVNRHGSESVKGTGLGLAMVKSIAEKHEGRAWCESATGKGSTFFISLPLLIITHD
jgi:PAS domain S-box-containing protein